MTSINRGRAAGVLLIAGAAAGAAALAALALGAGRADARASSFEKRIRPHFDHTPVIRGPFQAPQDVTRACLSCHPKALDVMRTPHFTWLGDEVTVPGHPGTVRIGKKNLINNFCISTVGNEQACTKCHAGYGWADAGYDFSRPENVDCLVCHEHDSGYVKGVAGMPEKGVDLTAAARSVGTPGRDNCLTCHAYGGGGQAVKHGDIDSSLVHPPAEEDVHMGKLGFLCVDCHAAPDHQLRGRAFSVSVEDAHGVSCTDCHTGKEHRDARIEGHLRSVACQTCHVPTFARKLPTKASWDWSKAGDPKRPDDPHRYLKIKGEFVYEQDAIPEYRWFDLTMDRYLMGDRMDPAQVTDINRPRGGIGDPRARIWPFKIHRALQPYDEVNRTLLPPVTGGAGGYWTSFDWDSAFRLGEKASGLPYSGKYGFARTEMYWPQNHMVAPKEKALGCTDCHGAGTRLDWKALGYPGDPIQTGGRP
ncbi:MAG TPA: tetrathionate reductase family octaheme c-type cytochrome [Anaeromyxobacter sp.]|nr:tetrathionate reductase family octaheme c-type cytochrome [Anaeromyxobacter sp.]